MPDDPDTISRRLEQARSRRDGAPPYSPEWDAAMDQIEDLERRLARVEGEVVAA